jgi:hypothetical protein
MKFVICLVAILLSVPLLAQEASPTNEPVELQLPALSDGPPSAGKRVAVTPAEYEGTNVHHMIYLPKDWVANSDQPYPVIVEYTGNQFPASGSTGKVEDSALGFGISGGNFIWVTLPFVSKDHQENAVRWWGDENATIEYAITNVPRVCAAYRGDPNLTFLCGFSRGAIAANYIGLHNNEIAKLWCGFITHDHFDGVKAWGTAWGSPLEKYRKESAERLARLGGRPYLVCQNGSTQVTADYILSTKATSMDSFAFLNVDTKQILGDFPNKIAVHPHTDRWLLSHSETRQKVWDWVSHVLDSRSKSP